jgi:hypothetical protein
VTLRLAVDFDSNDWCALYALTTDQPNQFRFETAGLEAAANISEYARVASSGVVGTGLYPRYDNDRAKYGKGYVTWAPSAAVVQQMYIGTNLAGVDNSHSIASGTVIAGGMWVLRGSGSAADTWRLRLYNIVAGTVIASSAAVTLSSSAFTRFTVSGTAAGATSQYAIILERVSGTDTTTLLLTGAMLVNGSTVPTWYNSGPDSLEEPLTSYWMGGGFGLGFVKPYQYVAPVGKADLRLKNHDKRFSPEYASGPHFGDLLPNLLVQIGDPDRGIWWTGWTDGWAPEPGQYRDNYATLKATDARRFLANKLPVLELYTLELPETIVADIMSKYSVPNSTAGIPTTIDGSMGLDAFAAPLLEWYADNVPYDHDGVKVLADIMGGAQGHLWFGRVGGWNARLQQGDDTPATYTNIGEDWLDMGYETGMIINKCEVMARKRKAQSAGPYTVWEADDVSFSIAGLGTEVRRVFFKYDNTRKEIVGAVNLTVVETNSGAAGDITAALSDQGANSAVITFTNNNAASRDVTAASITATNRVAQLREFSKEYSDSASITANGSLSERLDFNYVQDKAWAKQLARYRVTRFKDARYEVPWITFDVNENPADAFACHVGSAVRVADTQTGHDDYYAVIGEQHTVKEGLTDHTVKLYLQPLYPVTVNATSSA